MKQQNVNDGVWALESVPAEMREQDQWVVWGWRETSKGDSTKVPGDPKTGKNIDDKDPANWVSFEQAAANAGRQGGVAFCFGKRDPYCGADLDDCRDPATGEIEPWAWEIIRELDSYTEISPSGTGVKIYCRGVLLRSGKRGNVEMYDHKRMFCVTGQHLEGTPTTLRSAQEELVALNRQIWPEGEREGVYDIPDPVSPALDDSEVLEKVRKSKSGAKFERLWAGDLSDHGGDHSSADLALVSLLAFYTQNDVQLNRLFRESGLMRPKWDERHRGDGANYGVMTVEKALAGRKPEECWMGAIKDQNKPKSNTATITAADLLNKEFAPIKWVVPDILPEGVTILGGKPKIGKSWLAFDLALGVSTRGTVLGDVAVERGPALVLALEDNERRLQRRLKSLMRGGMGNRSVPEDLHLATEYPRVGEGFEEALRGWLEDNSGARLVVVDTLKKVRPRVGANKGIYDADYEALEPLLPLAAEFGVSILVLHHTRKMDADDPVETLSGSFGLSGGADGIIVLKRDRGAHDAALHVTGRDIENDAELALKWDHSLTRWVLMGEAEEHRRSESRKAILSELANADEPMSRTDLAIAVGAKDDAVRKLLWKMGNDGEVERVGPENRPKYQLPQKSNNAPW